MGESTSTRNVVSGSTVSITDKDIAEFPNSIPDINPNTTTTDHDPVENTEYDGELDCVLLQTSKNNVVSNNCLIHPGCSVNESSVIGGTDVSTTLAVLKRQCKVNLQQLTTAEINDWTIKSHDEPVSSSGSSTASDSKDDIPLSQLRGNVTSTASDKQNEFSSEDDILLIDFHKPRMRSRTAKKTPNVPQSHFPHKTKAGVHYEESAVSGDISDDSPARKKKKVNPLLLPSPSNDRLHAQGYITRNKSKEFVNDNKQNSKVQESKMDASGKDDNVPAQNQAMPKGNLEVTIHGLVKPHKVRKFKCLLCEVVETSRKELNEHHKTEHNKVTCSKCGKEFNTPSSRDCQMYSHNDDLKFSCTKCVKCFAFESQLRSHAVIHRKLATLKCNHSLPGGGICKKWFKRDGELKKHIKVHDQHLWKCAICDYSTFDERNLKQHCRRYTGEKPFKCRACNQSFMYWTQRICHKYGN